MHMQGRLGVLLLLHGVAAYTAAHAETAPERAGPPSRPFFIELRYTPSELFRADLKDEDGRVTAIHRDMSGTVMVPTQRGRVNFAMSHDRHAYRFRENEQLVGLLDDARETRLTTAYMGALNETWSLFGMASVRWAFEKGASTADSRMQNGSVVFQHQWRDHVQFGIGALASSRLDEDPLVIPTASVTWELTDRLTLRTMRGLHLLYKLDQTGRWQAGWNSEYHSRHIRLNDEGRAPNGVFRSRLVLLSLSLSYRPNPGVTIAGELGYVPWREITIKDADGATAFQSNVDPGISAAFTARMTF